MKRLLNYISSYKLIISFAGVAVILFTMAGLVLPWALKVVIDKVLVRADTGLLLAIIGLLVICYAFRLLFMYISQYLTHFTAQRVLFDLRLEIFRHLQRQSMSFYNKFRTGKLISNVITDVSQLQQMFSAALINLVSNSFLVVAILGVLLFLNIKLTILCAVVLPLYFMSFLYFKNVIHKRTRSRQELVSEISGNLAETINGMRVVKSFGKGRTETCDFTKNIHRLFTMNMDISNQGIFCAVFSEVLMLTGLLMAIGAGSWMVIQGSLTVGEFVAFYSYLGMLFNPIVQLSNLSPVIAQGTASLNRVFHLLDTQPEINDTANAQALDPLQGNIFFENINFAYGEKTIIEKLNLEIKPGESVAFVGPSGSGKSTIANLLLRFYDVKKGRILIDGHDIKKFKLESYIKQIGVVTQDPFLFSGTVKDNISYGKNNATDEEIFAAAKQANAHEFIMQLENGYESLAGENGAMLSGGQKQRISIARAILMNPKILILDEATSALDTESEKIVQSALDNLMKGKTSIIIAHRLSTIVNADKIVVMNQGEIIQVGTHTNLIKNEGLYRNLCIKSGLIVDEIESQKEGEQNPPPVKTFEFDFENHFASAFQ